MEIPVLLLPDFAYQEAPRDGEHEIIVNKYMVIKNLIKRISYLLVRKEVVLKIIKI
jgi:hypothetical protein